MNYMKMMRALSDGKQVARKSNPGVVLRSADTKANFGMVVLADGTPWNTKSDPRAPEAVTADDWEVVG